MTARAAAPTKHGNAAIDARARAEVLEYDRVELLRGARVLRMQLKVRSHLSEFVDDVIGHLERQGRK